MPYFLCPNPDTFETDTQGGAYTLYLDSFVPSGSDVIELHHPSAVLQGWTWKGGIPHFMCVKSLTIPNDVVFADDVLLAILGAFSQARHVTFGRMPGITEAGFVRAMHHCAFQIKSVIVGYDAFNSTKFGVMFDLLPGLQDVTIRESNALDDSHLEAWIAGNDMHKLHRLKLIDCYFVTNKALRHVVRASPNLEVLQFTGKLISERTLDVIRSSNIWHLMMDDRMLLKPVPLDIDLSFYSRFGMLTKSIIQLPRNLYRKVVHRNKKNDGDEYFKSIEEVMEDRMKMHLSACIKKDKEQMRAWTETTNDLDEHSPNKKKRRYVAEADLCDSKQCALCYPEDN